MQQLDNKGSRADEPKHRRNIQKCGTMVVMEEVMLDSCMEELAASNSNKAG